MTTDNWYNSGEDENGKLVTEAFTNRKVASIKAATIWKEYVIDEVINEHASEDLEVELKHIDRVQMRVWEVLRCTKREE